MPGETPITVGIGLVGTRRLFSRATGARRAPFMPGYWEFPGGKCEPGELPVEAVERECLEETGLAWSRRPAQVHDAPPLSPRPGRASFSRLHPGRTRAEPAAETGFCWVPARELAALRFPEANEAVVAELAHEADGNARHAARASK